MLCNVVNGLLKFCWGGNATTLRGAQLGAGAAVDTHAGECACQPCQNTLARLMLVFRLVQDWKIVHSGISISYPDKAVSANEAREVAEKIRLSLAMPYHLTLGQTASASAQVVRHCSASMGVVLFRNHDASQDDILRWADVAMYQAKDA